jgi:3-oxoacyl-[acyl-carrier protein] reductase
MKAIVTGASSGLGKAIYNHLLENDWQVYGLSKNGPDYTVDLAVGRERNEFVEIMKKVNPKPGEGVDFLVNCAGVLHLDESKLTESLEMVSINLIAVWDLIEKLYPLMNHWSNIINIASVSGMRADPDTPLYGATKAGVISLTKSYAKKFSIGKVIRVNSISPGFFSTNLVPGNAPPELLAEVPFAREADPLEILTVVKMILDTPYLTGVNIAIDGGMLL